MTRETFRFAAVFALTLAVLGCGGGDDNGPTQTINACAEPWAGQRGWIMRGGCEGAATSDTPGGGTATFSGCTLTLDVTPNPEEERGATWTLTANLETGQAQVVRANTACPGTDTGTVRVAGSAAIVSMRTAPTTCQCTLVYTINIPRPL
jgi:hypothetical protein